MGMRRRTEGKSTITAPELSSLDRLLDVQQHEREWLAYELHDRLAQTIVSATQELRILQRLAGETPEVRVAVVRASMALDQALRELRTIMDDLNPPLLDKLGLPPLVRHMVHDFRRETGCDIELTLACAERLPHQIDLVLYRILHEAIVNIERHAQATTVHVLLICRPGAVEAEVVDDGVGFDPGAVGLDERHVGGLLSMRRRAELVGGNCRVDSEPGRGTRVNVSIPVRQEDWP